jgi:hypothetical protein
LSPAVIEKGAYELNSYAAATTEQPGQSVHYTVNFAAGDYVYFEVMHSQATTDFILTTPNGRKKVFSSYGSSGPYVTPDAGTYSLTADPRYAKLGDYEFLLHKLEPGVIKGGALPINSLFSTATTQPGQVTEFSVDLPDNSVVYLDVEASSNTTDFILSRTRKKLFSGYGDTGPIEIRRGASLTLQVDPRFAQTTETEAVLYLLDPAVIDGGRIAFEALTKGATLMPGQIVSYEVIVEEAMQIGLNLISASVTTDFILSGPGDAQTRLFSSYRSTEPVAVAPGTYRLTADPRHAELSEFEFRLIGVKTGIKNPASSTSDNTSGTTQSAARKSIPPVDAQIYRVSSLRLVSEAQKTGIHEQEASMQILETSL